MRLKLAILLLLVFPSALSGQKQDTVKPRIIKHWNLSSDFTEEIIVPFDTVFSLFNRYRLADKYSPFNATLGSYGLPFYQINFFERITDPDKFLYSHYYPFMHLPERYLFMNTQVPFTELVWTFGGAREVAEQTFKVRHSQNVNRYLNFGLVFDVVYNLGQYSYQRAINKNFAFNTSYTGEKYKLYFAAGINNISTNENGGIADNSHLSQFDTRDVEVKLGGLNEAAGVLKNRNFMLVQRYTVGSESKAKPDSAAKAGSFRLSGTFSHILTLENNRRTYSDNMPESGFYDTIFINKGETFDSLYSGSLKNTLRFDFSTDETRKFRLGGGAGIRNEFHRYSQINPSHGIPEADTATWKKNNFVITGRLYNNIGEKFRWTATGDLYLSGYRAGDFFLKGIVSKGFAWNKSTALWNITAGMSNILPSFWYEQWGSNHFEWKNTLDKEFRIDVGTDFSYPGRNTKIRLNYAVIDNYTDFDSHALPSQHSGGLSVVSLYLNKDLKLWKFHLSTDVLFQQTSNEDVLDLPFVTLRSAGYFEHLFVFRKTKGNLNTQIGADVTVHSSYYPYNYMPATGRFYRQDKETTGNYPFINVFLNLKLRRTRIFVMFDHVNAGFMGYDYFMVPSYPMNYRLFRYGIAWTFYN